MNETKAEYKEAQDYPASSFVVPLAQFQEVERERDEATETLDLMCDEFQRIKASPNCNDEIITFCDRAISGIKQRVPIIVQRDKAERECDKLKCDLYEARAELADIRQRLKGHPDSRLDGENGLAAATMRSVEGYEKELDAMREAIREASSHLRYIANEADAGWDARDESRQALIKLQPFIQ